MVVGWSERLLSLPFWFVSRFVIRSSRSFGRDSNTERDIYVADGNTVDEVLDAMRTRGVDGDAALELGALQMRMEEETYRRTGEFDRETMLEFWEESPSRMRPPASSRDSGQPQR